MNYYGQTIDLMQQSDGWVGIWWHPSGYIEVGVFPTSKAAWDAVVDLIQRECAVRSLLSTVEEWYLWGLVSDREYTVSTEELVQSVFV